MMSRSWNRVWVTFTILLISFISYSSQIFLIWPWYGSVLSFDLLKLLIPFNAAVFMVFWNYRLCVITPPGGVPPGWRPNMEALENMEVKKGSHGPRFCKNCDVYKPPRAHHCRQCRTCVLKLDHHCPWIANCVGFHNQGHFVRFLLWVDIATSYHLAMVGYRAYDMYRMYYYNPTLTDVLAMVTNFATGGPVWICVGLFSLYHLYLAAGNSTTIEGWEKDKVATLIRRGKIREIKYPYNIGFYRNLQSVLGPNPLLWLWPQKMQGDGLSYPVNPDAGDPSVQYTWPPQDPSRLPNPRHFPTDGVSSDAAFVYGNQGFNPNLRPSNAAIRSRQNRTASAEDTSLPAAQSDPSHTSSQDDGYKETGSMSSDSRSSSPEPYLSDYDDENWGPMSRFEDDRMRRMTRRGSEGWEVRPSQPWLQPRLLEEESGGLGADETRPIGRPWEEAGRYNLYDPNDR